MLGSLDAFVGGGIAYQDSRNTSFKGGVGAGGVLIAPPNSNFTTDDEYAFQRATTTGAQGSASIVRPRTIGVVFNAEF